MFWHCDTFLFFIWLLINFHYIDIGREVLSECSLDDKHESPEINKIIWLIISHIIISIEINNIYFEISFTKYQILCYLVINN
jgi:hypothetical protein